MLYLLFLFIIFGIFIYYQIQICKNYKNKKLGLILPIGSSLISTFLLISISLSLIYNIINFFIDKLNNNTNRFIITLDSRLFISGLFVQFFSLIMLIIILFIPSIIFTLIYLYYNKLNNIKE